CAGYPLRAVERPADGLQKRRRAGSRVKRRETQRAVTEVDRVDAPAVQDVPETVAAENRVRAVAQIDGAASENGVEVTGADIGPGDLELLREQLHPRRVLVELLLR